MNRRSTLFLRAAVVLIGLIVIALIGFTVYDFIFGDRDMYTAVMALVYLAAIPFYYALYQTMKILSLIDNNKAFSKFTVDALNKVKYCAFTISGLYAVCLPFIFSIADKDDAPGLFLLAVIIVGTSLVIATSAGVLQKLLENAIDIKSENDLTV